MNDYETINQLANQIITTSNKRTRDRLTNELITLLNPLIIRTTIKYKKYNNFLDLQQDARLAVLMALKSFKPGFCFLYWAKKYITTNVSRAVIRNDLVITPFKKQHLKVRLQPKQINDWDIVIDEETELKTDMKKITAFINRTTGKFREEIDDVLELNTVEFFNKYNCNKSNLKSQIIKKLSWEV